MVLIGMPVKVKIVKKKGYKNNPKICYKEGIVIERHTNFIVVQFPKGYKECFKESDLIY